VQHIRTVAGTAGAGLLVGSLLLASPASASPKSSSHSHAGGASSVDLHAKLRQLNRSGARGTATATVRGTTIDRVSVTARGLAPDGPDAAHAVHVHYGQQAENECPTMGDATQRRADGTRRLNVADGVPYYGGIVASLTTSGDTSPTSALALGRMPQSTNGVLRYSRTGIPFTDVAGAGTAAEIAKAIRSGKGVVVVHGNDYNKNGMYDFAAAGASELTAAAPAEATDPTLCGVLESKHKGKHGHDDKDKHEH
jgi:hypothetical protein